MEILRPGDNIFSKFGRVYITTVYLGVVKNGEIIESLLRAGIMVQRYRNSLSKIN